MMCMSWSLLWLSLAALAKCRCSLQYVEKEEKSADCWKSESQILLKNEIWSKLGGEELFRGHVKGRLIFQEMTDQMFS